MSYPLNMDNIDTWMRKQQVGSDAEAFAESMTANMQHIPFADFKIKLILMAKSFSHKYV